MDHCQNKKYLFHRFTKRLYCKSKVLKHRKNKVSNILQIKKIVLVGTPNVGKSIIFNRLTGRYVTVSNYPGTTVEISRGKGKIGHEEFEIIDTPGMYSLIPITEEERVTRELLLAEKPDIVLHVVDAKNLHRMLPLTLQLIEMGLPVILVLNMMDEAHKLGIKIDVAGLETRLGISVVATAVAVNKGVDVLKQKVYAYVSHIAV